MFYRIYISVFILFLTLSTSFYNSAEAKSFSDEVISLGLTPLNRDAVNLELRSLKNSAVQLNSVKGKWTLLVFFASWCGPCMEELPLLETIYPQLDRSKIDIIGISIDDTIKKAIKVKKRLNLSFPIFYDFKSEAAQIYSASSIPLSYLITPDFKLAGVARGLIDWGRPSAINSLQSISKIDKPDLSSISKSDNGKALPNDLIPPKISFFIDKSEEVDVGDEVNLIVSVEWEGEARRYIIRPPEIKLPDGVTSKNIYSKSSSTGGKAKLNYILPVLFNKAGDYELGPAELSYSSPSGGGAQYVRSDTAKISVAKSITFRLIWISVLIIMFASIIGILLKKIYMNRNNQKGEVVNISSDSFKEKFSQLEKDLVRLNSSKSSERLIEFSLEFFAQDQDKVEKLKREYEQVKFGGKVLSRHEVMSYKKDIERLLNRSSVEDQWN